MKGCVTVPHTVPLTDAFSLDRARALSLLINNPRPAIRRQGYETAGVNPYEAGSIEAVNFHAGQTDWREANS